MNTDILYAFVGNFELTDAALIRLVLPDNTAKRLARAIGLPLATARCWLYRGVSLSRRRELAMRLLIEMDKQDVPRESARRVLLEWAGGNSGLSALASDLRRDDPPDHRAAQAELPLWQEGPMNGP